mmetsp:Transcript_4053/g.4628  ORF Transcript_4053/g.4628 Transcript_4053/m.4628 type:complete len:96 (+) Transcript_4053:99-386(+)|eukprot:CAMPEP_0197850316 /NCGR_PEP_ID=MMETSP1438-20131217/15008_1 /TAXON_ID=1461541 /ORGANISM="Pterosperma sp., Strain CCMP1384" /LENGTH=95 /DNA_ID=CAMNT_0043463425 /DNA_START=99 /DNA_END=386 /DNA_ORIENTATION=+
MTGHESGGGARNSNQPNWGNQLAYHTLEYQKSARGKTVEDPENSWRPNRNNFAPRPKGWKAGEHTNEPGNVMDSDVDHWKVQPAQPHLDNSWVEN